MIIIYILIGLAVGVGSCYLVLRSRLRQTATLNTDIEKQNQELEQKFNDLTKSLENLNENTTKAQEAFTNISNALKVKETDYLEREQQIKILEAKRDEIQKSLEYAETQAKVSYDTYIEQQKSLINEKLNTYYDKAAEDFTIQSEKAQAEAENEYLQMLKEQANYFQAQTEFYTKELQEKYGVVGIKISLVK